MGSHPSATKFVLVFLKFLHRIIIMKIICAGFPKTGTKSMAHALSQLGYSVHDFEEHMEFHLDRYLDFFEGRVGAEVFLEMYKDVDVVVDQPACTIWNILRGQFPDAKVILMERDSSLSWVKSYTGMFAYYAKHHQSKFWRLLPWLSKTQHKIDKFSFQCIVQSTASTDMGCLSDTSSLCLPLWQDQYIRHNAAVKALVPPDQLLVYQAGEGWDRLCAFLGKDIPATEFPHENKGGKAGNITDQLVQFGVYQRAAREVRWSLCKIAAFTSLGVLAGWGFCSGRLRATDFKLLKLIGIV